MSAHVTEPSREIPVSGSYDVVVVGGGIAGCAAAVAAARNGASVAIVEKTCALGGLATLGNVVIYLPLCDGMGNQVIRGLGEELLKLSIRDGYDEIPPGWRRGGDKAARANRRYRVNFNPSSFILALEELLVREGVAIHYDTRFCTVRKTSKRIAAVVVENKSGRSALRSRTVIDASGDADVCAQSGEPTVSLATNSASAWFFYTDDGRVKLRPMHVPFDPCGGPPNGGRGYAGDDAADVTQHLLDSRQLVRKELKRLTVSSDGVVRPLLLPTIPAFRMTRRLRGEIELKESHERERFPDSVGMTGDWRKPGPVYYIPFRALAATRTDNLLAAGRCMSAASAWDITRAIPTCAVTGEAAGVAAAMAASFRRRLADLDVKLLQERLRKQRVLVMKHVAMKPD